MEKFAFAKFWLCWVLAYVLPEICELPLAADQVVKLISLPKFSRSSFQLVDCPPRKPFPCSALLQHRVIIPESRDEMDVVWHHNRIRQKVAILIERPQ